MAPVLLSLLAASPVSVVVLDAHVGPGVEPTQAQIVADEIASAMPSTAYKVTTSAQLATVLGLERQKQLMGCAGDSGSCTAELANALGADIVVQTTLAKTDTGMRCNVVFTSGRDGAALERVSVDGAGNDLFTRLHDAVAASTAKMFTQMHPDLYLEPGTRGVRRFAWAPTALAIVLIGVGASVLAVNENNWHTLTSRDGRVTNPYGLADTGRTLQTVGWALCGVGVAAAVAAGAMGLFGAPKEPRVVVAPLGAGSGGAVFLSGVLP